MTLSRRSILALPLAAAQKRPNIVFVLVDDLRWDELGCTGHPFASTPNCDRLAREGAMFSNAFSVAPLCSPSRGVFLTGVYPHTNGIVDNLNRSEQSHRLVTWPRVLRDHGYDTAFIGKWHMGNDDSPRPGFVRWVSFRGQGECIDPDLNVDGKIVKSQGYVTDILTDYAVRFVQQKRNRPFCLYVAHKAIHPNIQQRDDGSVSSSPSAADDFIPAERHRTLYEGARLPRRPNWGKPPRNKPALERQIDNLPPLGAGTGTSDKVILNRMRMMKAVDESLGRIVEALERSGQVDNTVVVFTSDHGYFYGEHGLGAERRLAYEESIRIPLLIRYPRDIRTGTRIDAFALNLDIAPTMLAFAGADAPPGLQGRSLRPLLTGTRVEWRDDFLIEYYSDTVFSRINKMGYHAVRGQGWKYIHYNDLTGADEFYDLRADPYEMKNILGEGGEGLRVARRRLRELLLATGIQAKLH